MTGREPLDQMVLLTEKCTARQCGGRVRYSELTDDRNTHWHVKPDVALTPLQDLVARPHRSRGAANPRESCTSHYAGPGYPSRYGGRVQCCIDAMTEGACFPSDLCAPCTRWLADTVDRARGYSAPWHPRYCARP